MDKKGYYKILKCPPGSSIDIVKRSLTRATVEYHPDQGTYTKKVKSMPEGLEKKQKIEDLDKKIRLLNEARQVLSDPEKKKMYDQGIDENAQQFDMGGFDIYDIMTGGRGRKKENKVQDTEHKVRLTLKDAFLGIRKSFTVKREIICTGCSGKGGQNSSICQHCKGQGEVSVKRQMGFMFSIEQRACNHCSGMGNIIKGPQCRDCEGNRYMTKSVSVPIDFKKGFEDGDSFMVKGMGDEHVGAITGDLVIIAQIREDPHFRRIGPHLVVEAEVELYTALCGGTVSLRHIDGNILTVEIDKLNNLRQDVIVVRGGGFPDGDLFIEPRYVANQIETKKLVENLSMPSNKKGTCRGALGKLPDQQRHGGKKSGFKETIFSQFFSGF